MKPYRALLTFSTLAFSLGWGTAARADDEMALSFDLAPVHEDVPKAAPVAIAPESPPQLEVTTEAALATVPEADAPLPIPVGAEAPPLSGDLTRPAGVYGGIEAMALGNAQSVQALLPAPPPATSTPPVAAAPEPLPQAQTAPMELALFPKEEIDDLIALNLDLEPKIQKEPKAEPIAQAKPAATTPPKSWDAIQAIFEGGTDSLVARAVGSAEGTRTPEGHKNPAYFGHVDPGNGVWNLGTFSYQHAARSPEDADAKQLQRLQGQTEVLRQKAQAKGLELTQEELLNGIDLANQAPLAALDRGGYIDWLKEAHKLGMTGSEAIVWARTRSFIDPDTQRWNAPGLGNNVYSISHDQERRANAIARAISATQLTPQTATVTAALPQPERQAEAKVAAMAQKPIMQIGLDLSLESSVQQAEQIVAAASAPESAEASVVSESSANERLGFAKPTRGSAAAQVTTPAEAAVSSGLGTENKAQPQAAVTAAAPERVTSDPAPVAFERDEIQRVEAASVADAAVSLEEPASELVRPESRAVEPKSTPTEELAKPEASRIAAANPSVDGNASLGSTAKKTEEPSVDLAAAEEFEPAMGAALSEPVEAADANAAEASTAASPSAVAEIADLDLGAAGEDSAGEPTEAIAVVSPDRPLAAADGTAATDPVKTAVTAAAPSEPFAAPRVYPPTLDELALDEDGFAIEEKIAPAQGQDAMGKTDKFRASLSNWQETLVNAFPAAATR